MQPPIELCIMHDMFFYCMPEYANVLSFFNSFIALHEVVPYLHSTSIFQPSVVHFS